MSDRDRTADEAANSYDPAELRSRIVVCFSAQELRLLAADVGLTDIPVEGSAADVARAVVRQASTSIGLTALVRELRAARPLVEWPSAATPKDGGAADSAPTLPELNPPPMPAPTEPASLPSASSAPLLSSTASGPGSVVPRAEPWITSGDGIVRPGGLAKADSPPPRLDDPRVLGAIGGLILVVALIAFAAARFGGSSSRPATADAANTSTTDPDGATARALASLARAKQQIARTCEVPAGSEDILVAAYERCGPAKPEARPFLPIPPAELTATRPDDSEAGAPTARPTRVALPPGPNDGACMKGCERTHASCKSACGAEPKESSQYGAYQACLSQCLAKASSCRLACAR